MKNCAVLWVAAVSFPLVAQGNINTIKPTAFIALKKGSEQYACIDAEENTFKGYQPSRAI